jgi:hypothetical protein
MGGNLKKNLNCYHLNLKAKEREKIKIEEVSKRIESCCEMIPKW